MKKTSLTFVSLRLAQLLFIVLCTNLAFAKDNIESVAALGRIEPEHGIINIGAASTPESTAGSLMAKLYVNEGESVVIGQLLAETGSANVARTLIVEAEKSLALAKQQYAAQMSLADATCVRAETARNEASRREKLRSQGLAAAEEAEFARAEATSTMAFCKAAKVEATAFRLNIDVAQARIDRRQAELERKLIYAPIDGLVLQVNAYPGEFVGPKGILELAAVENMYAVAEIYETDIKRVKLGQKATITSEALTTSLRGKVTYIHPKVQKHDAIGTDPAAKQDARIIEVDILLDKPEAVRYLTNLQVEIVLE